MAGSRAFIYQIFYNEETRGLLDPGFIPLDNTANLRPEWYEFWVIRQFLNSAPLDANNWYGFLSPRFAAKTGLSSANLFELVRRNAAAEVVLLSFGWDQLAYFLNVFEQGDHWHPGLKTLSQTFLREIGVSVDLDRFVTHIASSVFSNYVIAKPRYWDGWLRLANAFFDYVETGPSPTAETLRGETQYGSAAHKAPMRTFVQERLSAIVLGAQPFRVATPSFTLDGLIHDGLFVDDPQTRRLLMACDLMKQQFAASGDGAYLDMYRRLRAAVPLVATSRR